MPGALSRYPVYVFDPGLVFPEIYGIGPHKTRQSTVDADRKIAALTLVVAYLLSGQRLPGVLADMPPAQIHEELLAGCEDLNVDIDRVFGWAESLLIPPEATLAPRDLHFVPTHSSLGFTLHPYQRETAAWSAFRKGSVLALGCGTGKTITAIAAAVTAAATGQCSTTRCAIVAPINAMGSWERNRADLEAVFKQVVLISVDSLHHYEFLDPSPGGALIVDEVHRLKNGGDGSVKDGARRTRMAHRVRRCFEWSIGLTGTFLHTGAGGVLSVLDLACPGLSRYTDQWAYGRAFASIVRKKIGRIHRRSLTIPPEEAKPAFVTYLERGVRSLSFASPEVTATIALPGQTKTLIDTFEKPPWLRECEATVPEGTFLWAPTASLSLFMGALAVAMQAEGEAELLEAVPEAKDVTEAVELLTLRLNDPFTEPTAMKEYVRLIKLRGMPIMARLLPASLRFGRFDQVIEKITTIGKDETKSTTYRFRYGPGHDRKNPGIGPKLAWVFQWLDEHPDEPLVLAADGRATVQACSDELTRRGIDHRIIRGGVDYRDRMAFEADFDTGKFRVMLCQQVAGSESISLVRASTSIIVDAANSPIPYTQFLARTCRQGQNRECEHYDLAFNQIQVEWIARLIRGEEFDAAARARLETEVAYIRIVS